jgi:hypothetical protein
MASVRTSEQRRVPPLTHEPAVQHFPTAVVLELGRPAPVPLHGRAWFR